MGQLFLCAPLAMQDGSGREVVDGWLVDFLFFVFFLVLFQIQSRFVLPTGTTDSLAEISEAWQPGIK